MAFPFPVLCVVYQTMTHDIVIIGGGLAGGAAAARIAAAGRNVLLLEKETDPHHKVCGEFMSWETCSYLKKLGIDIFSLGATKINALSLHADKQSASTKLPFPAASVSRRRLDQAVLRRAAELGADIRCGMTVNALDKQGQDWVIACGGEKIVAENVFLATGKRDVRNWGRPIRSDDDMIGLKMHLRLSTSQAQTFQNCIEMFLFDGGYAGLEPIENDLSNLCMAIRKPAFKRSGGKWETLIQDFDDLSPALSQRLKEARFEWKKPLTIYGIPYGFLHQEQQPDGLFRLGDQMAVIPSFAGDGMAMALHSAFLASATYLCGGQAEDYHRAACKDFRYPMTAAKILSAGMNSLPAWTYAHSGILAWFSNQVRLNRLSL